MGTCGMYDFAGEWAYRVGLPAKSGVAGGVIAVLPGQFGIGVYSPRARRQGQQRARHRGVPPLRHRLLAAPAPLPSPGSTRSCAARYRGDRARSNRVRTATADAIIAASGRRVAVYELDGDLHFSSTERVFRTVVADLADVDHVMLDFRHVGSIDSVAVEMLADLDRGLDAAGVALVLAHVDGHGPRTTARSARSTRSVFVAARAWTPRSNSARTTLLRGADEAVGSVDRDRRAGALLVGLSTEEMAAIEAVAELVIARPGETIVREGDEGDRVFFVLSGAVSVQMRLEDGRTAPAVDVRPRPVGSASSRCWRGSDGPPTSSPTRSRCSRASVSPTSSRSRPSSPGCSPASTATSRPTSPDVCAPPTHRCAPSTSSGLGRLQSARVDRREPRRHHEPQRGQHRECDDRHEQRAVPLSGLGRAEHGAAAVGDEDRAEDRHRPGHAPDATDRPLPRSPAAASPTRATAPDW